MKHKLVDGPLGFPLSETIAKEVDTLLKTLPKECKEGYRKASIVPSKVDLVDGERCDISLISTNALDRQGEVTIPGGMDLSWYRRNPIVTFAHKYDELPVGKCKWIKLVQAGVLAKTEYSTRPDNWQGQWLPDACFALCQQGALSGKSVGYLPTKMRGPTQEELKAYPSWADARVIIESCVLLEYAIAPVPVNPEALTLAVNKGLIDEAILTRLGIAAPKRTRKRSNPLAAILSQIDGERVAALVEEILAAR